MPRYLVQRSFPGGLALPANETGAEANRSIVKNNALVVSPGSTPMSPPTRRPRSVSTTGLTRTPSVRQPSSTISLWFRSLRSRCSTPTSITDGG
jgi:hypothetical protein